jgi:hypothetical protein
MRSGEVIEVTEQELIRMFSDLNLSFIRMESLLQISVKTKSGIAQIERIR